MLKIKDSVIGVIAGLALGAGVTTAAVNAPRLSADSGPVSVGNGQAFAPPPGAPRSFADIIEKVSPAVVAIETKGRIDPALLRQMPGAPIPVEPQEEDQDAPPAEGDKDKSKEKPRPLGAGSGFFISSDGYIVTNNHVIENADEIWVKLSDDRKFQAKIIGRDENTDLAVLKIEATGLPYVEFETQAKPRVGDWVIAVGNPFGFSGTATAGIVSAKGRNIGAQYNDFLQIDAPINKGNSGGPTFDIYGRVIGVNSIISTPSGGSAGIGFAIPSDIAKTITDQLIHDGHIERGYIGVQIQDVTDEFVQSLKLKNTDGAYIADVTKGGPADKGGLRAGDIITAVDGEPVKDRNDLSRKVGAHHPGQTVVLTALREDKTVKISIKVTLRPSEKELASLLNGKDPGDKPAFGGDHSPPVLGLSVAPIDPALRRKFDIPFDVNGAVVAKVDAKSEAGHIGFKPGDVILSANGHPVSNAAELKSLVEAADKDGRPSVLLLISRGGRNIPVPLALK